MNVLETTIKSILNAASFNKHELASPRVILWPDEERSWEQCIDSIRKSYSSIWSLGNYAPEKAIGPAAWLRYELEIKEGEGIPVLYLPGIGRSAFRNAEHCPDKAKHLFALQFQGQFWTQRNGKDWTPFAFFSSKDGGLGLDVAGDQETKKAVQESLCKLMEVEFDDLKGHKLEAADFRVIVTQDPIKTLLRWMSNPTRVKEELEKSGSEWASFRAICRDIYQFDPDKDGVITAAEKLTSGDGAWVQVWDRFKEVPQSYWGVKQLLDPAPKGQLSMFEKASEYKPSDNREEEKRLEADLCALSVATQKDALAKIISLATDHVQRANWVWAKFDESPLAMAICHLRDMAEAIKGSGNPATLQSLAEYYATIGWKVDRSMLKALDAARTTAATKAVTVAIRAVYLPWLQRFSELIQAQASSYPVTGPMNCSTLPIEEGTVYLFADGLRMDLARSLEERLISLGLDVQFEYNWSALPTVTATAKYAWLPLAESLGGPLEGVGFEPKDKTNGNLITHDRFKKQIEILGISFLIADTTLFPTECSWTEFGDIDTHGHNEGAKLAWRIEEELTGLQQRIIELVHIGWKKIKIITDHGWLLLPGGLPKTELPKHLTASRWNRCAIPSPGANHGFPMTSWFWDNAEAVVLAPNVSCFTDGMEYAHGGLTLQESLVPLLTISPNKTNGVTVVLKELKWSGMRLNVIFEGAEGLLVDVRTKAADESTKLTSSPVTGAADGEKTSLLIEDDNHLGLSAYLVVVNQDGQPVFKKTIVIGEN